MQLFEENIELLLQTPEGPVGLFIEQKAAEVQAFVRTDVSKILERLSETKPELLAEILDQVDIERDGADARIGFVNTGQELAEYLAHKSVNEQDKLTAGAMKKVFGD